jgi:glycosyltransferase involved in cell wall biosynthesis
VSLLVPFYNEGTACEETLSRLASYADGHGELIGELLFVDDGSTDGTCERLTAFAAGRHDTTVVSHAVNQGLDTALRTGFSVARHDLVAVLDADLSYEPANVERLFAALVAAKAALALASPYARGGRIENVPPMRAAVSIIANRFLRILVGSRICTLTGMVRVYDLRLTRALDDPPLRGEFNTAIALAALRAGLRIVELPAALRWPEHRRGRPTGNLLPRLARRTVDVFSALTNGPRFPKVPTEGPG